MDKLPPCPHCSNGISGVYRNVRANGLCTEYFNMDGNQDEIETSNLTFTEPVTLYCSDCGKKRNDIYADKEQGICLRRTTKDED